MGRNWRKSEKPLQLLIPIHLVPSPSQSCVKLTNSQEDKSWLVMTRLMTLWREWTLIRMERSITPSSSQGHWIGIYCLRRICGKCSSTWIQVTLNYSLMSHWNRLFKGKETSMKTCSIVSCLKSISVQLVLLPRRYIIPRLTPTTAMAMKEASTLKGSVTLWACNSTSRIPSWGLSWKLQVIRLLILVPGATVCSEENRKRLLKGVNLF